MALSVVATNPAFQHVDASRLAVFANAGRPRRILLGTVLMDRGDAGAHLYLLLSGRVLVERPARGFAPRRVNELEAGEFVGEAGSLPRAPQTATVTALTDLHVVELSRDELEGVFDGDVRLLQSFLRMVHHRLHAG